MSIPEEFTSAYITKNSASEDQLYTAFLKSGEPYRSLARKNYHQSASAGFVHDPGAQGAHVSTPGLDLSDDALYYNTRGSAADYWAGVDLPKPTKNIEECRADLCSWGYCLIEEALSPSQTGSMKRRLEDQAKGERLAGIASWMGTAPVPGNSLSNTQFLHSLINKGAQFIQCVEHDPAGVQAGLLIEQLLNETLGSQFLMSSFIAIISNYGNMPQGLHQDQSTAPFQDAAAPYTCNTMYIMDDMDERNGGTLVVPGSHQLLSEAGSGRPVTEPLPPAINLAAPSGTVMIFDGRLLHGTGVNKSNDSRTILVMNSIRPFMRQQELHMMSAATEVLTNASSKLLYRLGARPQGLGGIEGAWNGDYLVNQRLKLEQGEYEFVRELSPDSPGLNQNFTYRISDTGLAQAEHQPETLTEIKAQYQTSKPSWQRPKSPRFPSVKKRVP